MSDKQIIKKSLGEEAAAIIRKAIIEGDYSFGQRLVEEQLAQEFNISRFSVRDGLRILETEDLVIRERNKSTRIIEFDRKKIEDIYSIRLAIELFSIKKIVHSSIVPVMELQKNIDKIKEYNASSDKPNGSDRSLDIAQIDIDYHKIIIYTADNQYVIKMWKLIENQILSLYSRIVKLNKNYAKETEKEHAILLESLCAKDLAKTEILLSKHIGSNIELFLGTGK